MIKIEADNHTCDVLDTSSVTGFLYEPVGSFFNI
jgi:hypothetical protein